MKDINVPEGLQTIMPYLIIENACSFINFMIKVFDATEIHKIMRTEELVRHAQIKIGDSVIMLADSSDEFKPMPAGMFIYVTDADETYSKALNEGATSVMPPADQDYGRSCGVKDPFGNTWWITSVLNNNGR